MTEKEALIKTINDFIHISNESFLISKNEKLITFLYIHIISFAISEGLTIDEFTQNITSLNENLFYKCLVIIKNQLNNNQGNI